MFSPCAELCVSFVLRFPQKCLCLLPLPPLHLIILNDAGRILTMSQGMLHSFQWQLRNTELTGSVQLQCKCPVLLGMQGSPDTVGSRKEVRFESQFFSEAVWFQKDVLFMSCDWKIYGLLRWGLVGIDMSQPFFKGITESQWGWWKGHLWSPIQPPAHGRTIKALD